MPNPANEIPAEISPNIAIDFIAKILNYSLQSRI